MNGFLYARPNNASNAKKENNKSIRSKIVAACNITRDTKLKLSRINVNQKNNFNIIDATSFFCEFILLPFNNIIIYIKLIRLC